MTALGGGRSAAAASGGTSLVGPALNLVGLNPAGLQRQELRQEIAKGYLSVCDPSPRLRLGLDCLNFRVSFDPSDGFLGCFERILVAFTLELEIEIQHVIARIPNDVVLASGEVFAPPFTGWFWLRRWFSVH